MKAVSALAVIVLFLAGAHASAATRVRDVAPSRTDAAIDRFDQPHRVFLDPDATPRAQLLVYLPGTAATTSDQDQFGLVAARAGYHVVFLMYPNDTPAAVCQDDDDPATFEKFRREILAGSDLDERIEVNRANSIENRLLRLVQWLAAHHADEGWQQFLASDGLDWGKLALAGHSQGGGHAQLLAKDHAVSRVVVLASPKDYNRRHDVAAPWYGGGATPARRMFALVHEQDTQAISYTQQLANLRASGLDTMANIDVDAPPYDNAHILTTNAPGTRLNSALAHLSLAFDFTLPRRDGKNLLEAAWVYMLTEPMR